MVGRFRARLNNTHEPKTSSFWMQNMKTNHRNSIFDNSVKIQTLPEDNPQSSINPDDHHDKLLLLRMVMKAADVSHPCKPRSIHLLWTARVTREFYSEFFVY